MNRDGECCGMCGYHRKDWETGEWCCTCPDSDYEGLETEYKDTCDCWEER